MGLALRDRQRHSHGEYRTWDDGLRWELIHGEAYLMSPAPTPTHQRLVLDVARQIADALEGHRCEVFIVPFDVRLPRGAEAGALVDTVVRPGAVIDWERVPRERPAAE